MATNSPKRQAPKPNRSVIEWLLDSDPSIRWQVMRDLIGADTEAVATEGWGARLLARQQANGHWGGDPDNPEEWSCLLSLLWLRDLGLDPSSSGYPTRFALGRSPALSRDPGALQLRDAGSGTPTQCGASVADASRWAAEIGYNPAVEVYLLSER